MHGVAIPAERARRFAAARRHSRLVRALRWLLPGCAVIGVAFFVGISVLRSLAPGVSVAAISIEGSTVVMSRPRLTGFDARRRPYELTADRAMHEITSPRVMSLENVRANLELAANGWARLSADKGNYDGVQERMRVVGNVHIVSSLGYEIFMQEADMDMKADVMTSDKPVEVRQGPNRIFGDRMRVTERNTIVVFEGNVRTIFHPSDENP